MIKKQGGCYDRLSGEDALLASHIADMAEICGKKYIPRFSAFLDGRQAAIAESVLNYEGFDNFMFFGGFEGASRVVLGVFPPYSECEKSEFPVKCLAFRYREEDKLTHRDFLGSVMACGVNRNMIGDIIVNDGYTAVFVYDSVCSTLVSEIKKIGSVGVKISVEDEPNIVINEKFSEISGTVSSLRLDCVVSLAARVSREKSAQYIRAGNVTVNYDSNVSVSDEMKSGDVFSVRGFGKFILSDIDGKTKKDRLHIRIKKYI